MSALRPITLPLVVLIVVASMTGCGGSSDSDPLPAAICIAFADGNAPASASVVARQGAGSGCELVEVELLLTDVTDVFAVSFQALYDPTVARYEGYTLVGSQLSSDGASVSVVETTGSGQLQLGLTRTGVQSGVDFSGPRALVKLLFSPQETAEPRAGALQLTAGSVIGSETPPQPKAGIEWSGGSLQTH